MSFNRLLKLVTETPKGLKRNPEPRELVLVPGADRSRDLLVDRRHIYLSALSATQWLPRGRPGVMIQFSPEIGGDSIVCDNVFKVDEVHCQNLEEFCRDYGVTYAGEPNLIEAHEAIPHSVEAFHFATQDGRAYCMRTVGSDGEGHRVATFLQLRVTVPREDEDDDFDEGEREHMRPRGG